MKKIHFRNALYWQNIYDQSYIGDIPTKGKFNSLKAPWRSIIKGVEWFIPQINEKSRVMNCSSFAIVFAMITVLFSYTVLDYMLSQQKNGTLSKIDGILIIWNMIYFQEDL